MPVDDETLEFLMTETAAVNAARGEWKSTFGFDHDCHCDRDYAEDNTGTVTECWAKMAEDAMEASATFYKALTMIASGQIEDPVSYAQEFSA